MPDRELGTWRPLVVFALALSAVLALAGCGGTSPSLVDGEWDYSLVGAVCVNGKEPSGTLVVFDNHGALSGQYDICGLSFAYADLAGRVVADQFDLILFRGTVGIVHGQANGLTLTGQVTGLGEGVTFKAERSATRKGKVQ